MSLPPFETLLRTPIGSVRLRPVSRTSAYVTSDRDHPVRPEGKRPADVTAHLVANAADAWAVRELHATYVPRIGAPWEASPVEEEPGQRLRETLAEAMTEWARANTLVLLAAEHVTHWEHEHTMFQARLLRLRGIATTVSMEVFKLRKGIDNVATASGVDEPEARSPRVQDLDGKD